VPAQHGLGPDQEEVASPVLVEAADDEAVNRKFGSRNLRFSSASGFLPSDRRRVSTLLRMNTVISGSTHSGRDVSRGVEQTLALQLGVRLLQAARRTSIGIGGGTKDNRRGPGHWDRPQRFDDADLLVGAGAREDWLTLPFNVI
jgi:hypothetical protein